MINLRSPKEIEKIKASCAIVRDTLFMLEELVKPGVQTIDLDRKAEEFIRSKGAKPGFKGLYGFPATLCISVNDEVVHGIPSKRTLKDGDVVGIDCGTYMNGFYGDHAKTFKVGNVDPKVNEMCLKAADYKGCVELNTKKTSLPKCNIFRKDNCIGEIISSIGKYEGELSNNMPNGYGTLTLYEGYTYVGQWKDGKYHGQGTYFYNDGNRYEGEWKDDKKHGQGTYFFKNGDRYKGKWKDDKKPDQGTYYYNDGDRYKGEYKDNKRHGKGTYYYSDGNRYEGEWKDDKKHGQGTFFYKNGDRYKGEYKDGQLVGQLVEEIQNNDDSNKGNIFDTKIIIIIIAVILLLGGFLIYYLFFKNND